jgi:leucyl aminopeptidase (aminopeptidase T)
MKINSEIAYKIISLIPDLKTKDVISVAGEIHNGAQSAFSLCEISILEELAMVIRKKNAFPLLDISTERLQQRFFAEISPEAMQIQPTHYLHFLDYIKAFIEIGWKHITPQFNPDLSSQKQTFISSAEQLWQKIFEQKKKIIFLNYPSPELAVKIQQNYEQLLQHYINLIDCDYDWLQEKTEAKKRELTGRKLTIFTQESSIELVLSVTNAASFSGTFSTSNFIILPTGKIEIEIDRDTIHGNFLAEKCYYKNEFYNQVAIQFQKGEINNILFTNENKGNFVLQNACMNSKRQCFLSLGMNPGSRTITNYYSYDRCIDGNLALKFADANGEPILFTNHNVNIKNK